MLSEGIESFALFKDLVCRVDTVEEHHQVHRCSFQPIDVKRSDNLIFVGSARHFVYNITYVYKITS